ncbi:MAG: hypothetical protein AAGE18_16835 [Pseudomonadota bacterium]
MLWTAWWIWVAAGLALGILELVVPGYIFLGFAIGAVTSGILLAFGGPIAAGMTTSLPLLLVIFGVISLVAWLALRRFVGIRRGQVKVWDRDINEN